MKMLMIMLFSSLFVCAQSVKVTEVTEQKTLDAKEPSSDLDLNGVTVDVTYYPKLNVKTEDVKKNKTPDKSGKSHRSE